MVRDDWDDVLQIRPLESMAREAIGEDIHFLNTWFEHPDNDELWQMSDWQARSKGARIPALIFSGWFDDDGMGTTQALELVHDWPAAQRKAVLGRGSTALTAATTSTAFPWACRPSATTWTCCTSSGWTISCGMWKTVWRKERPWNTSPSAKTSGKPLKTGLSRRPAPDAVPGRGGRHGRGKPRPAGAVRAWGGRPADTLPL